MDTAKFLRTHSTVVFNRPRGLVSPGAAWQRQNKREGLLRDSRDFDRRVQEKFAERKAREVSA